MYTGKRVSFNNGVQIEKILVAQEWNLGGAGSQFALGE